MHMSVFSKMNLNFQKQTDFLSILDNQDILYTVQREYLNPYNIPARSSENGDDIFEGAGCSMMFVNTSVDVNDILISSLHVTFFEQNSLLSSAQYIAHAAMMLGWGRVILSIQ